MFFCLKSIFTLQQYRKNLPKWLTGVCSTGPFFCQEMDEILARCREAEAQSSIGPYSQAGDEVNCWDGV